MAQERARLSQTAHAAISDEGSTVFVSAARAWEIAIKHRIGKWPEVGDLARDHVAIVARERFVPLPVWIAHALRSGALAHDHRDPFDRLIAAQADCEGLVLVTNDRLMSGFGVAILW